MADNNSQALWLQICGMVAMFTATFLCYLLPIFIFSRRNRRLQGNEFTAEEDLQLPHHWSNVNLANQLKKYRLKRLLSYCNCVSAGVFLGVCFLNLIPCVEEEFAKLVKDFDILKKYFGSFPLGQFSVICGLFLVLILESLLSGCFKNNKEAHSHGSPSTVPILYLDEESNESRHDMNDEHNYDQEELLLSNEHREDRKPNGGILNGVKNELNGRGTVHSSVQGNLFSENPHQHHHQHHGHSHLSADIFQDRPESMLSFFILMFATSIHSLFEGLALGLQSDISTAIHLFIGIILHECLVALALGLNAVRLQQHNHSNLRMHIKFAFLFSLTIPVGNIFGILLGYTPGHFGRFISAIFQGFAAGTFIHVTFLELIPEELLMSDDCDMHEGELIKMLTENSRSAMNTGIESTEPGATSSGTNLARDESTHPSGHSHSNGGGHSTSIKIRKILLLLLGFIIMTLVPFLFGQ